MTWRHSDNKYEDRHENDCSTARISQQHKYCNTLRENDCKYSENYQKQENEKKSRLQMLHNRFIEIIITIIIMRNWWDLIFYMLRISQSEESGLKRGGA